MGDGRFSIGLAGVRCSRFFVQRNSGDCCRGRFGDLHPVHRMTPNRLKLTLTDETCQSYKNLYLDTDAGQLDCLSEITGVGGYPVVRQSSEAIEADGREFHVLTLDALIAVKKAMNRPHDQEAQLEAVKKLREK